MSKKKKKLPELVWVAKVVDEGGYAGVLAVARKKGKLRKTVEGIYAPYCEEGVIWFYETEHELLGKVYLNTFRLDIECMQAECL